MERIGPRTVKHACGASIIAPAQEIIAVEVYFDSSLGALQVQPLGRRLGLRSLLTSVKAIPFRDMRDPLSGERYLDCYLALVLEGCAPLLLARRLDEACRSYRWPLSFSSRRISQ